MVSEKQRSKKRILILIAVVLVLAILALLALWIVKRYDEKEDGEGDSAYVFNYGEIIYKDEVYTLNKDVETILVMGLDNEQDISDDSYNNPTKADFVMLCAFDRQSGKCHAINFNRDTITDVPHLGIGGQETTTVREQLALAFSQGSGKKDSCLNVQKAVKNLYDGIVINNYIAFNMEAVPIINDAVGGVTVTVEDDFGSIDHTLKKGEKVTLKGKSALTYVRQRKGLEDSSNLNRIARQQQYLEALFKQAKASAQNNKNLSTDTLLKLNGYMQSSCSANKLNSVAADFTQYEFDIWQLQGESKKGEQFMEFYCNEDALQSKIIELLYKKREQ